MDKKRIREENERTSPAYWTVDNVVVWIEDIFNDKKLKNIFLEHEIDGPVLTKHLDYQMLRYEMGIVIGKATKIIDNLVDLLDKWEIPSAKLLNENLDLNLTIGSLHREESSRKIDEEQLEEIKKKRILRSIGGVELASSSKRQRLYPEIDIPPVSSISPDLEKHGSPIPCSSIQSNLVNRLDPNGKSKLTEDSYSFQEPSDFERIQNTNIKGNFIILFLKDSQLNIYLCF
ncbi:hypothetical protein AYI68_g5110 [Smittium mucronatum]|uniref:SAM domain-containing protein n=1 Tax=Smittium mucronatum TaxID=133383 RepID=A0A1R0GV61_9FUNG|nr:hypothetical protein AYI68_g5110 [Smittium mucronatum]